MLFSSNQLHKEPGACLISCVHVCVHMNEFVCEVKISSGVFAEAGVSNITVLCKAGTVQFQFCARLFKTNDVIS